MVLSIIILLCIYYTTFKLVTFLVFNIRRTRVNYYFECIHPFFAFLPSACPKICMKAHLIPFSKNKRKNKQLFSSCLKNLLDFLMEDKIYKCTTHLIIKKHLERHKRVEIISCKCVRPRSLVLEKAMVNGTSVVMAFFQKATAPNEPFT